MFLAPLILTAALAPSDDPTAGRKLVFSDTFQGSGPPDIKKWQPEVGKIRNNEAQYYTDMRADNCRQENGHLVIEGRKEDYKGSKVTSAAIETRQTFTHAYYEVKAKCPTGRGTWPAIWLLGSVLRQPNEGGVGWPACGEVDIMENVGFDPTQVHFSIHCQKYNWMKKEQKTTMLATPDFWKKPHVYGLDMRPDRIDFYYDHKKVYTYTNEKSGHDAWPYDEPMFLILNLAIGGDWGGQKGIDDAIFPSKFVVDYVKVYK